MEVLNLDLEKGTADILIGDDEQYIALEASFYSNVKYVDDSFDHAFGTHHCGHFELELDDLVLNEIDREGEPNTNYQKGEVMDAIHLEFDNNYCEYIDAYR